MPADRSTPASIDALNSLLRGERSAVETYDQAISKFGTGFADGMTILAENRDSHRDSTVVLERRIAELNGDPSDGSGMWGAFARLVEGGAALFGRDAAIAALEEGEDHGLAEYREALDKVDPSSATVIRNQLLPAQERTHRRMSVLKNGNGAPPAASRSGAAARF